MVAAAQPADPVALSHEAQSRDDETKLEQLHDFLYPF
jgi:hypothetical protein